MNTNIILYDDCCPLCAAYTNAFVQTGLLAEEGRKKFSNIPPELIGPLDMKRSVNEIPLIDTNTKQVWYGIDALLEILSQKIPFIKPVGNSKPINWLLCKLYKFISYNRRVIVANTQPAKGFDCTPDFNVRYRILFMLLFLGFNTWMLFPLQHYLLSDSLFKSTTIQQLQWAHITLVTINILLALRLGKKDGIEYLGQVNMLALITILFTIPLLVLNKYLQWHSTQLNNIYLGMAAACITSEYYRRMKFANIIALYPMVIFINVVSVGVFLLYLVY